MSDFQLSETAIAEFLAECEEVLARVTGNLTFFEKNVSSPENLDELYRDMHTLKGSSQLFGFTDIGTVAHAMETCLDPIRRLRVAPTPALLDALFACVGLIEKQVGSVR